MLHLQHFPKILSVDQPPPQKEKKMWFENIEDLKMLSLMGAKTESRSDGCLCNRYPLQSIVDPGNFALCFGRKTHKCSVDRDSVRFRRFGDLQEERLRRTQKKQKCRKLISQRPKTSGVASPQRCMVCGVGVKSRKTLAFHLKHVHPESRPYRCMVCGSTFNNSGTLACHRSNVHQKRQVKCKSCAYTTITKARMKLHVRSHTTGIKCSHCEKCFPNTQAFQQHLSRHGQRKAFDCSICDKVFASSHSLNIHLKGKHGQGYRCRHCNKVFESPAQQARHCKSVLSVWDNVPCLHFWWKMHVLMCKSARFPSFVI